MTVETATTINQLNNANPSGSDAKSEGDDHLRLLKSTLLTTFPGITGILTATHTQLNKIVSSLSVNASAPASALVVGSTGNVGVNLTPSAWGSSFRAFQTNGMSIFSANASGTTGFLITNGIYNGTDYVARFTGGAAMYSQGDKTHVWYSAAVTADTSFTFTEQMQIDANGYWLKKLNTTDPTIATNSTLSFSLPSDTQLKISVRGSDGVTRTATLALS